MLNRTYTVRLYPNKQQVRTLEQFLFVGRVVYNRALEARIHWYKTTGKTLSYFTQTTDLTELRRACQFFRECPLVIERDALMKLDKSFEAFFRRVKSGDKPGFPRFKGERRWNSFGMSLPCTPIVDGKIRVSKVNGLIRARNMRTFDGKIKEQRILRRAGKWYCQLVVELDDVTIAPRIIRNPVGIDVGLKVFAAFSDGTEVENPRFGKKLTRKLAHAHRNLSRSKKGSRNRRKRIARLQRVYDSISNSRSNFTHHLSKEVVRDYDLIAVEDLNIKGMIRGRLSKSILDAAWNQFTFRLAYKAENAGCLFVKVNPRGTSQECSQCGAVVPKDLSVRVHACGCGLTIDRDLNAARNVLKRALVLIQHPASVGRTVMPVEDSMRSPLKQEVLL